MKLKSLLRGYTVYILTFCFCYLALYFLGVFSFLPSEANILKWDACWYASIKDQGYYYHWYENSNSAFFPLFPYIWKFLFVGNVGISLVNFILVLVSLGYVYFNFDINIKYVFIYLSIPSCIFFFLPFSEAVFFLFSSILLIGLHKNNTKLIVIGLLFTSLTRGTAMFFIPAIVVMEFISAEKLFNKRMIKNIMLYSFIALAGLLLVVLFQYAKTGEWFAFAKQQVKYWRHHFSMPGFPLISFGGTKILWLDSLAFFFCVLAFILVMVFTIRKLIVKNDERFDNRAFWFSASYLFMAVAYGTFFNPKALDAQTCIEGTHRYVFASCFFFIFFSGAIKLFKPGSLNFLYFLTAAILTFLLFGLGSATINFYEKNVIYEYPSALFFSCLIIYASLYYLSSLRKYGIIFSYVLISINVLLSIKLFYDFTNGVFIA